MNLRRGDLDTVEAADPGIEPVAKGIECERRVQLEAAGYYPRQNHSDRDTRVSACYLIFRGGFGKFLATYWTSEISACP